MKKILITIFIIYVSIIPLHSKERASEIAKKMIDRNDGRTVYTKVVLVSCYYDNVRGKMKCKSDPRKKLLESILMDTGKKGVDSIGVTLLIEPPAEKGMAMLQKDYDDPEKDTEQWLYLPAMRKLKRIVAASSNSPKTGTLFGSEIANEDIERVKLAYHTYRLAGQEEVDGRIAYIIETKPTKLRAPKTSYGREKWWVDKNEYFLLKAESYDRQGKLAKTFYFKNYKEINDVWLAHRTIVVNHKTLRMSMMKNLK